MEYRKIQNTKIQCKSDKPPSSLSLGFCIPQNSKFKIQYSTRRGVATLPAVMVMGAIALAIAVSITVGALSESFISQGSMQSSRALFYAEAGAHDVLIKIARDKNYTVTNAKIDFSTNGCSLKNDCATVTVAGTNPKTVTSVGTMKVSSRTMQVVVTLDSAGNGEITNTTWSEI